jgi:hypothetical protein
VSKTTSKKRKNSLPRPKLPCPCIYMMQGVQEPDPKEGVLKAVDWDGPGGVAATVELDGKEYHMALSDIIPIDEDTGKHTGYLIHWITTQFDAKDAAAKERKKLWNRSLAAILESEG